jgi:type III secretion protein J
MKYRMIRLLAVFCVAFLCACGAEVPLQTGLIDADANEVLTLLRRNGISATKLRSKEGVTLLVKEDNLARSGELMRAAGLPKRTLSNLGQMFKKEGMISTPLEERARYLHGLSQELEYTLAQIDGVITARVHIVLPERVAPGEPVQPSSASVFIKHQLPFDEDLVVPRVRRMVANSIPGLGDESGSRKLSVVLLPAQATSVTGVEWEQVGPLMLETSSAASLRNWLWLLGAVLAVIGVGVLFLIWRISVFGRERGGIMTVLNPKFLPHRFESNPEMPVGPATPVVPPAAGAVLAGGG